MGSELLEHSPLGASGAYRWMVCPGSVGLSRGVPDDESEEAALGTAAHALAEYCQSHKVEPWTLLGQYINKQGEICTLVLEEDFDPKVGAENLPADWHLIDKDMVDAVTGYLLEIDLWHPDRNQGNSWVERKFHCPEIHKDFYGTGDYVHLTVVGDECTNMNTGETGKSELCIIDIWDYKHGIGIVVEATDNPQLMYYAAGVLEELNLWDEVDKIRLHIYQPRGWHWKGPHRVWEIDPDDLDEWLIETCVPSMNHALVSRDTKTGDHCRFCPARQRQCPALMGDMAEYEELLAMAEAAMEEGAEPMTAAQLGRILELESLSKIVIKAARATAWKMLSNGNAVPGTKLVNSRTNRIYKDEKLATAAAKKKFGAKQAMTEPALKSPAQIDALPGGTEFTARWGFKPQGGTTIALDKDTRRTINRDTKSLFSPVSKGDE